MRSTRLVTALYLSAALLAAFSAGCGKKAGTIAEIGNIPPTVRLTQAPFDDGSAYFYAYRLNWLGNDPDGRVTGYVYAIDPPTLPGAQIPWIATDRNEQIIFFEATQPDPERPLNRSIDFHTFAIAAVDDDADTSEVIKRSFFSFTTAPTVSILTPRPSSLVNAQLTPAVRISWTGSDVDGQFTSKPIKYKFLLIGPGSEFPVDRAVLDPDSVRRFYAPDFAGWDSTSADTTQVQFTNLTPGQNYIFVVVAFDEAGAYSPLFDLGGNMLRFRVGFAGNNGPKITMFNEFFFFQYASGGYSTDPSREVFIEVPADARINFNWFAEPAAGSDIQSYRWSLDIPDVADNTPRDDEINDVTRWSAASLLTTQATVGPFGGGEVHRFYIEALDNNGLRSLGIVRFQVVKSSLDRPLGIVDDTRFLGDNTQAGTGCVRAPLGAWPTAAELDTFLFAKGGNPWRCYPAGTISPPGLFAGYEFDTIGTRTGLQETVVRLSRLGQYKHVVWIVDAKGATYVGPGSDPAVPITALRYMSGPGRFNALAAYVKQGGRLWLTGGGGAMATTGPWNNPPGNNNDANGVTFSSTVPELIPGRFMYDLVTWRSEIKVVTVGGFINRLLGRNTGGSTWPGAPDYNRLPVAMRAKSVALDPFPPGRAGQSPSIYYKSTLDAEFLSQQNFILEDLNPDPDLLDEQSVLDTLYHLITFGLPGADPNLRRVTMTYYHGVLNQELVFTGFNIWDYTRADCQSLVNFVLQDIWELPRTAPASTPATAVRSAARVPSQTVANPAPAVPVGAARPALSRSDRTLSRE
jgi:hypothetical protein